MILALLCTLPACGPSPPTAPGAPRPPIRAGSVAGCNKLTRVVKPGYPAEAQRKGIRGTVSLRVRITKAGEVSILEVLKGEPLLVPAATKAVSQWRYTPCVIDGEAVEAITVIDISFGANQ
ncbi:energy transducer TonB [uncultured Paludibaculum sp.]|uniref:energy transducer TonB n=1 Tax=uncultured Paludibaculum sp. TaxID=1765020 RepID=UPI002AAACA84|nr:energy transducer TonB [uncultured Paludibaculum sp.]